MTSSISYAITTHNEGDSIEILIERIKQYMDDKDELIILDDYSVDLKTLAILAKNENVYKKKFNNDYSTHKNYLNSYCECEYIFQFDGDELPAELLLSNIKTIITQNLSAELFWIPRDNRLIEIDMDYIKKWKWKVDTSGRINYPDYQGRLYKNSLKIHWTRKIHEVIVGYKNYMILPPNAGVDILHSRHMSKQIKNNKFYEDNF